MKTRVLKRTFGDRRVRWVVQHSWITVAGREVWHEDGSYRWRWLARLRKRINDMQAAEWTVVDEQIDDDP